MILVFSSIAAGIALFLWSFFTGGSLGQSVGVGILGATGIEYILATFFTRRDYEISKADLEERSKLISQQLRDFE